MSKKLSAAELSPIVAKALEMIASSKTTKALAYELAQQVGAALKARGIHPLTKGDKPGAKMKSAVSAIRLEVIEGVLRQSEEMREEVYAGPINPLTGERAKPNEKPLPANFKVKELRVDDFMGGMKTLRNELGNRLREMGYRERGADGSRSKGKEDDASPEQAKPEPNTASNAVGEVIQLPIGAVELLAKGSDMTPDDFARLYVLMKGSKSDASDLFVSGGIVGKRLSQDVSDFLNPEVLDDINKTADDCSTVAA